MIHYLGNPAFPGHSVFPLKVSLHQGTNVRKVNCEEHSRGLYTKFRRTDERTEITTDGLEMI